MVFKKTRAKREGDGFKLRFPGHAESIFTVRDGKSHPVNRLLDPGGAGALAALSTALPGFAFASLDALRDLLKTANNRGTNTIGLKEDVLAHEAIMGVLDATPTCRARVVTFCEALVCAATGANHAQIVPDAARSTSAVRVVRFSP
jgi:hypothetical protein